MAKKQPSKGRNKSPTLGVRPAPVLVELFRLLAEENRRTLTAELSIAMEKHLAEFGKWPPPAGK